MKALETVCVCAQQIHTCTHTHSFLCRVILCLLCDGCFLRASDLIQEVAWGSAHAEVAEAQKKAHLNRTPPHLRLKVGWVGLESFGQLGKGGLESNRERWREDCWDELQTSSPGAKDHSGQEAGR